jgi:hypothetical protein
MSHLLECQNPTKAEPFAITRQMEEKVVQDLHFVAFLGRVSASGQGQPTTPTTLPLSSTTPFLDSSESSTKPRVLGPGLIVDDNPYAVHSILLLAGSTRTCGRRPGLVRASGNVLDTKFAKNLETWPLCRACRKQHISRIYMYQNILGHNMSSG